VSPDNQDLEVLIAERMAELREGFERRHAALNALTRAGLLHDQPEDAALREITETAAPAVEAARVSVWRLTADRTAIVARDLFELASGRHSDGPELSAAAHPAYFDALARHEPVAADDARTDPRTRELAASYLEPLGITSRLDAPIIVDGRLEGVVCFEHVGAPRGWTFPVRSFAVSVANLVSLMIVQRARALSEARLRAIVESGPECVKVVSKDGVVLDMNPAGLRMLQATQPADVVQRPIRDFIEPADWPAFADLHDRVSRGASGVLQYRIVGLHGAARWVETHAAPLREPDGSISAVLSITRDITDQRAAEDSLRVSEERFRLLARATNDAIWDWNLQTNAVWWNEGYETLFGVRLEEVPPTVESWTGRIHPEDLDRVVGSVDRLLASGGSTWSSEYRVLRHDGSVAFVLDRGHVIRDGSGAAVRMVGGMSDLTERKQLEARLLQSHRLESVGRLAGGIAHDFNNVLTVILGTVDLHLARLSPGDELREDLLEVRRAGERAAGLTRQLLAFSRRQALQVQVINLNAVVKGVLGMLTRLIGEGIEMRFEPDPELRHVRADPGQFEQVLFNLAANARDAMPGGGTLTLRTRNVTPKDLPIAARSALLPGAYVMLEVADTGAGMSEDVRAQVFEPFFTTKPPGQGAGLGLSTVYGIVKQSDGHIWLDSAPGRGTRIRIYLRPVGKVAREDLAAPAAPPAAGEAETILLVEDEGPLRQLAVRILENAGYTVLAAASGEEALAVLARADTGVHLLLTDLVMPGMSGRALAEEALARQPSLRVAFMSGYTDEATALDGVATAARFISKPFTSEGLRQAVRDALDAPR
jgi:PAS domain S-box-containing protein